MKGRIDIRYYMPNVAKVRTRLEQVPEDLTPQIRTALGEAAAEVLEENQTALKAKIIAKLNLGDKAKKEHVDRLSSVFQGFYDSYFAVGAAQADAKFSEAENEDEAPEAPKAE